MEKLKVLDLFSGIGGFSLGLERTGGFETVAFCEIEPFCQKVLKKHWPEIKNYGDITTARFEEPVDLVTAGFPCQDISFAGAGAGLSGERSGLFWYIIHAVRMVGQPFILLENVAALLNRGMGSVLGAMAEIGYDAEWHCIQASRVGLPHLRDRVWIFANPKIIQVHGKAERTLWEEFNRSPADARIFGYFAKHTKPHEGWGVFKNYPEPRICRADDGIYKGVDRCSSLGNAVVPQIPEIIGNAILESIRRPTNLRQ